MNKLDLKNISKKYRPIPFWSWNERLETLETKRQIDLMDKVGCGGFFMHARGGLETEYMGDEWFENIEASIQTAKETGMRAFAYDENGWPSGFGAGKINALGKEYQQKILMIEEGEKKTENTICNIDGFHIYYEVNPFYVDNLDAKVVKRFIQEIYEPYFEKFKNTFEGFFTDEPQLARKSIPWSYVLQKEYADEYGEELVPKLLQLFKPIGDYKETRKKFWRLITKLFSKSYAKQIYDWCEERGLKFTGHLLSETHMLAQIMSNGACMPHYEYFHIPGMDWLERDIDAPLAQLQVASAALQTGKKQVISETFALCGHNVSFSELRRIYEWQMARGVNLLCQHLEGYSLRGIRKRDYPPAMYYQQPWWQIYDKFIESMSRIGMLISEGTPDCDVLLIHPQTSAWICYDAMNNQEIIELDKGFKTTIADLEAKHIRFHLGDEILMERHGRVEKDALIVGKMQYKTVVLPPHIDFLDNTKKLLEEFKAGGGRVITVDEIEENPVIDNKEITYLKRIHKEFDMHYFVNSTPCYQKARIAVDGVKLDIMTGDEICFDKDYTFTPYDSLVVLDYRDGTYKLCEKKALDELNLDGEWEITEKSENSITLDFCDCYFDDVLQEKHMPVSQIQERACALKKPIDLRCEFFVNVDYIPNDICLVCETPEIFTYKINGELLEFNDIGYFRDKSFKKTNISKYLKKGENKIELFCHFKQSEEVYKNVEDATKFETVRNKLTYDMEIENIYLIGDFSLKANGCFEELDKNAVRFSGEFSISEPKEKISLKNIEKQGFEFFAGEITVKKCIKISDTNKKLVLNTKGLNGVRVVVNNIKAEDAIWSFNEIDISPYLKQGENEIELTLINNLRNLLGPHHLEEGESYSVRPSSFMKGKTLWAWDDSLINNWNDGYCFVETSL